MRALERLAIWLLLSYGLCGCAQRKVVEAQGAVALESPSHLVGHILCDACRSAPTDEECIARAEFKLAHCRRSPEACLRRACVQLDDSEESCSPTPTGAVTRLPPPAVIILCATGGVGRRDGAIAFGNNCVLHDKTGAITAQALVAYDAAGGIP